ncbi:hypothetical protein Hanom_Chr02g00112431 [Helianthus anomalus]
MEGIFIIGILIYPKHGLKPTAPSPLFKNPPHRGEGQHTAHRRARTDKIWWALIKMMMVDSR